MLGNPRLGVRGRGPRREAFSTDSCGTRDRRRSSRRRLDDEPVKEHGIGREDNDRFGSGGALRVGPVLAGPGDATTDGVAAALDDLRRHDRREPRSAAPRAQPGLLRRRAAQGARRRCSTRPALPASPPISSSSSPPSAGCSRIRDMIADYDKLNDACRGVTRAEVTSAAPLSDANVAALKEALQRRRRRQGRRALRQGRSRRSSAASSSSSARAWSTARSKPNSTQFAHA